MKILSMTDIFQPDAYFASCHASTVAAVGGELVCAWFAGTGEGNDDVAIWLSRTENGVWSEPRKVADGGGLPCWNPVLLYNGGTLTLFYKVGRKIGTWSARRAVSYDGGRSFGEAHELVPGDAGGRGPVKNKCIELDDGGITAPCSTETDGRWRCFCDVSYDGGATFARGEYVPGSEDVIQPTLWQADGVLHMLMRSRIGAIMHSYSLDRGKTWSPAERTEMPNNNSGIDLVQLHDGRLALAYNPVAGNWAARDPLSLAIGRDAGRSAPVFGKVYEIDRLAPGGDGSRELSYPAVIALGGETVCVTYTNRRKTIRCAVIEI